MLTTRQKREEAEIRRNTFSDERSEVKKARREDRGERWSS